MFTVRQTMEAKNRRRQESPFTCLKPLIRVWGVATAIGECTFKKNDCANALKYVESCRITVNSN